MQKLINLLALTSFAISATTVAGATYIYLNKDVLIESAKESAIEAIKSQLMPEFEVPELPIPSNPFIQI
jgi:hypothetical protein